MEGHDEPLPDDIETLKVALVVERGKRIVAETDAAFAKARASNDQALIAHLKLQIEKLNRDRYGQRSERTARLLANNMLNRLVSDRPPTVRDLSVEFRPYAIRYRTKFDLGQCYLAVSVAKLATATMRDLRCPRVTDCGSAAAGHRRCGGPHLKECLGDRGVQRCHGLQLGASSPALPPRR